MDLQAYTDVSVKPPPKCLKAKPCWSYVAANVHGEKPRSRYEADDGQRVDNDPRPPRKCDSVGWDSNIVRDVVHVPQREPQRVDAKHNGPAKQHNVLRVWDEPRCSCRAQQPRRN
jgi:hypothetical protein